jgi:hypothetical protein
LRAPVSGSRVALFATGGVPQPDLGECDHAQVHESDVGTGNHRGVRRAGNRRSAGYPPRRRNVIGIVWLVFLGREQLVRIELRLRRQFQQQLEFGLQLFFFELEQ